MSSDRRPAAAILGKYISANPLITLYSLIAPFPLGNEWVICITDQVLATPAEMALRPAFKVCQQIKKRSTRFLFVISLILMTSKLKNLSTGGRGPWGFCPAARASPHPEYLRPARGPLTSQLKEALGIGSRTQNQIKAKLEERLLPEREEQEQFLPKTTGSKFNSFFKP
jgi:hypothetical protein